LEELINREDIDWDDLLSVVEVLQAHPTVEYLPESVRDWVTQKVEEGRKFLVDNGLLAEYTPPALINEPKAVAEAKAAASATESELTTKRNSLKHNHDELAKDYGPNEVFRALKDVCINREVGEYKYELCFFGNSYQRSLKDSSSSHLGNHRRIEIIPPSTLAAEEGIFQVDDLEESHQEKLSGWVLHHDGGAQCWNGPKRSVRVVLYCAVENEIRTVVETEKCVYKYEVGTPVVCQEGKGAADKVGEEIRDEL